MRVNEFDKRRLLKSPVEKGTRSRKWARHFCYLGLGKLSLGRMREAIEYFHISIRYDPTFADPHALLGMCYIVLDRNQIGVEHCARALNLGIKDPIVRFHLVMGYGKLRKFTEAKRELNAALGQFPEAREQAREYCTELFEYFSEAGDEDACRVWLEKLFDRKSTSGDWNTYSRALHDLGQYELSLVAAKVAIEIDQDDENARLAFSLANEKIIPHSTAIANLVADCCSA
jgi:tetratricopeptide (TPR) repeat protein